VAALPPPTPAAPLAATPAAVPGGKPKTRMPAPLRLDDQGREVDEFGRPIERDLTRVAAPTLKVSTRSQGHASLLLVPCCMQELVGYLLREAASLSHTWQCT
jgi:hypothetical protein